MPEILQHATPMLTKQRESWDGRLRTESEKCAQIPGDGRVRILMDMKIDDVCTFADIMIVKEVYICIK